MIVFSATDFYCLFFVFRTLRVTGTVLVLTVITGKVLNYIIFL